MDRFVNRWGVGSSPTGVGAGNDSERLRISFDGSPHGSVAQAAVASAAVTALEFAASGRGDPRIQRPGVGVYRNASTIRTQLPSSPNAQTCTETHDVGIAFLTYAGTRSRINRQKAHAWILHQKRGREGMRLIQRRSDTDSYNTRSHPVPTSSVVVFETLERSGGGSAWSRWHKSHRDAGCGNVTSARQQP